MNFSNLNLIFSLLLICSAFSLIIGTVVGLAQYRIKRLFAYSTVSHVGFMLLALSISGLESSQAFLFYLISYSITNLNLFFVLLSFGYLMTSQKDIENIYSLSGIFKNHPLLSFSMILCLFSMAGIPPLIGFFAKYAVLYTAIHNGFYFICFIAILTSVISAAYYLRIVRVLYFDDPGSEFSTNAISLSSTHSYIIAVLTIFILLFILEPNILSNSTLLMAMSIYGY